MSRNKLEVGGSLRMARRVGLAGFHRLPVDLLLKINSQAQWHNGFPSCLT